MSFHKRSAEVRGPKGDDRMGESHTELARHGEGQPSHCVHVSVDLLDHLEWQLEDPFSSSVSPGGCHIDEVWY